MESEFDAYKLSRLMCPSNYNRFWDRAIYWSKIVLAQLTNVTDGRTDRHRVTAIAALCIASHGKNSQFSRAMFTRHETWST